MSAIGQYIHLRKENYQRYGTARVGEAPEPLLVSYKAQRAANLARLENLRNKVNDDVLEELKARVERNYNESKQAREIAENRVNFNQGITDFQNNLVAKLVSEIPNRFGESMDINISLNQSNMEIDKEASVNIAEARKHRDNALSAIKTANDNFLKGKPIQSRTINAIIDDTDKFFKALGMIKGKDILTPKKGWENYDTFSALDGILKLVPLYEMNQSGLSGVFGEVLVNMASDRAKALGEKKLYEELKAEVERSLSTGEMRSSFSINESMITPDVQRIFKQETGLNLYQIRSSQNKVDASIIVKDTPIEASVKAYTPSGNTIYAHLQDVSLLTSLLGTQLQFANHWISLHSYGEPDPGMDELLTEQIMYEALSSGNILKQDASIADTFVAIDTVNGRVYVKSAFDILDKDKNRFILNPTINNIVIKSNKFANTWEQRIANIVMSVHQIKIKVTYRAPLDPL